MQIMILSAQTNTNVINMASHNIQMNSNDMNYRCLGTVLSHLLAPALGMPVASSSRQVPHPAVQFFAYACADR